MFATPFGNRKQEQEHKQKQKEQTSSRSPNGDIETVFAYFAKLHPRARLTPARKTLIRTALASYPLDALLLAIDGLHLSKWHNETGNLTLEYGLRNAEKIEKCQAIASEATHPDRLGSPALPKRTQGNVDALNEWARMKGVDLERENGNDGDPALRDVPSTGEPDAHRGLLPKPE
ncbi:MAG: hypothetical protein GY851_03630 [bacterium]|nr:hypothetical protein [bacterium]